MRFFNNKIVLVLGLALGFLGQECLGALTNPTLMSNGVTGSVTKNVEISDAGMKAAAQAYLASVDKVTSAANKPQSAGVSIWFNPTSKTFVVAAIGAGTSSHGEQNIMTICEAQGISFRGGEIATWSRNMGKFISACGEPTAQYPNNRNCAARLKEFGIKDVASIWNNPASRPASKARSLPKMVRSAKLARALPLEELAI
jgi:hypothetical protein